MRSTERVRSSITSLPQTGTAADSAAGPRVVQRRRMSQRKIELASTPKGQVLLELWTCGAKNLTTLEIRRATVDWSEADIDSFAELVPAWLRAAIKQSHAARKSLKIGLSGAYDWSNPNIKDHVLISKVLERHKFEDVVCVCLYYGLSKVKRVFKQQDYGQMTSASVTRMLTNISKGLKQVLNDCAAQGVSNSVKCQDGRCVCIFQKAHQCL